VDPDGAASRTQSTRLQRLDALKGVAIIAVVAIHALATGVVGLDRRPVAALGGVLTASVPVFMAAAVWSAARDYQAAGAVAVTRRLPRVLIPYATASVVYLALAHAAGGPDRARLDHQSAWSVLAFGGAWYHLYFLPALAQVLLLVPVIVAVARSRAATVAAVVAGGALLATGPFALDATASPLDLRWALVWAAPCVVGAAIGLGTLRVRRPSLWLAAGLTVLAAEAVVALEHGAVPADAYARVGVLPAVIGALAVGTTTGSAPSWLVALGRRSLGVYLLHPAALLALALVRDRAPYPLGAVPLVTIGATAAAYVVTCGLARTPAAVLVGGRREGAPVAPVEHNAVPETVRGAGTGTA
jgi:surface polysaccharide O-acyltransferase-like enzyme